ncbi:MAG TPA: hypothetical protein VGA31_13625, partial [Thermoanaerobaculia bacterium]
THRRIRLPRAVGRAASAADDLLQRFGVAAPRIHALSHLQTESACSIASAERELGYDPKIELEEGTRRAIRWCLEKGSGLH